MMNTQHSKWYDTKDNNKTKLPPRFMKNYLSTSYDNIGLNQPPEDMVTDVLPDEMNELCINKHTPINRNTSTDREVRDVQQEFNRVHGLPKPDQSHTNSYNQSHNNSYNHRHSQESQREYIRKYHQHNQHNHEHNQGYNQEQQDGYTKGYSQGYSQGYRQGFNQGRNDNKPRNTNNTNNNTFLSSVYRNSSIRPVPMYPNI